ncbi:hypothetical protein ACFQVB_37725 [Paraburkholderia humisilvae]|uniref:Uncharacterized protein n=1 Tax=Paraburkholderia humisilvae TaxID=627669 RepID=A0A6J5DJT6_9BURK|nr:hypothetical protein LMG29542_02320 [Paraburkholderia humisilvae]
MPIPDVHATELGSSSRKSSSKILIRSAAHPPTFSHEKKIRMRHAGFGKFCHRCANEARPALMAAKAAAVRRARRAEATAKAAAEDLARRAEIAERARRITEEVAAHRAQLVAAASKAPIDLSAARHLPAVLERALDVLGRLNNGVHPLALGGQTLSPATVTIPSHSVCGTVCSSTRRRLNLWNSSLTRTTTW